MNKLRFRWAYNSRAGMRRAREDLDGGTVCVDRNLRSATLCGPENKYWFWRWEAGLTRVWVLTLSACLRAQATAMVLWNAVAKASLLLERSSGPEESLGPGGMVIRLYPNLTLTNVTLQHRRRCRALSL